MKKRGVLLCGLLAALALLCGCQSAQEESLQEVAAPVGVQAELPAQTEPETCFHQNYMTASDGFFRPDDRLRRAECAQLLYNLNPTRGSKALRCSDVSPECWYYDAVRAVGSYLPQEAAERFQPDAPVSLEEFLSALSAALELPVQTAADVSEPALVQSAFAPVYLTRAQAAVLVNHALGRVPDEEAIRASGHTLLLDVPEDRADYAQLVEAVLPHTCTLDTDTGAERYCDGAADMLRWEPGVHLSGTSGYLVDESGCALRGEGFLDYGGRLYYRCDASGRILADYAAHYLDGHAVFVRADGILRRNCQAGEYWYDENGFYTTGSGELDEKLDAFLAACTTPEMTQSERLRASYDAVRALRYLGRNPAFGTEVKAIPYDKQLEFADKILTTGKGDCYNFAAVFCLLARRLGYLAVPVVGECSYQWSWNAIAHGWVEIEIDGAIWLFDPQIENYNLRAGISNETSGAYQVTYENAPARYLKH